MGATKPRREWKHYGIGFAVTLAIVVAAWAVAMRKPVPAGVRSDGYAAQVAISNAKVSAAQSMMAGDVIYYDGHIENNGGQTLTGYIVELTFYDMYGKAVKTVQRALVDNRAQPIPPHTGRDFEIGFDEFPGGWNQAPPTPRAVAVYVR